MSIITDKVDPAREELIVTANKPLIIDHSGKWEYSKIIIKDGGYIRITVPTNLSCDSIEKETGQIAGADDYDIYIVGNDGQKPDKPSKPETPKKAHDGNPVECKARWLKWFINAHATNGATGPSGLDGVLGIPADPGEDGPKVTLNLDKVVTPGISILNQGGNGGDGGDGGDGGNGGDGGIGGKEGTCGWIKGDGGNGGDGGKGGNGGNGMPGGRGGDGGQLTITCEDETAINLNVVNKKAHGGKAGAGGQEGSGGKGGESGGRGGSPGNDGEPGDTQGEPGANSGDDGDIGITTINGNPV